MVDGFGLMSVLAAPGDRYPYVNEVDVRDKTVLIRADLNVPYDDNRNITDDNRIRAILPTVNYCLDEGAKVILMCHMGRPGGKVVPEMSLFPVSRRLSRLLNKDVAMAPDCIGPDVQAMVNAMSSGDALLLENLRFHPEEQANDDAFAAELAGLADIYVNDAFAVAHREHASVAAITRHALVCVAGFLLKNELEYFHRALDDPARPLAAIIGGAQISSKISAVENLTDHADKIIIGGAMAHPFLRAMYGHASPGVDLDDDLVERARTILEKAGRQGVKFYLPVDCVAADRIDRKAESKVVTVQEVPAGWRMADIGPATVLLYTEALADVKTILWNGPMGAFEIDAFSRGTYQMARAVTDTYAMTIVGGGDTDVAVHKAGESSRISYISTGGGAFLKLMEGARLPGIVALEEHAGRQKDKKENR